MDLGVGPHVFVDIPDAAITENANVLRLETVLILDVMIERRSEIFLLPVHLDDLLLACQAFNGALEMAPALVQTEAETKMCQEAAERFFPSSVTNEGAAAAVSSSLEKSGICHVLGDVHDQPDFLLE